MEDPQVKTLHDAFAQTLAPNPVSRRHRLCFTTRSTAGAPDMQVVALLQELIRQAEAFLKQASAQPGYGISVLRVGPRQGRLRCARRAAAVGQLQAGAGS